MTNKNIVVSYHSRETSTNNKLRKVIDSEISKKIINIMDSVVTLYKELKSEWDKPAQNLRKCGSLLDQLKVYSLENK